jgi:hypothetical protein
LILQRGSHISSLGQEQDLTRLRTCPTFEDRYSVKNDASHVDHNLHIASRLLRGHEIVLRVCQEWTWFTLECLSITNWGIQSPLV